MEWALFDDVDERHVRDVLDIARRRNFGSGEIVFHQGDPADTLHLIRSGRVAVRLDAGRGESVIAAVLGPGEMFGELALLDEDATRSATIVALEPLETLSVHQLDFSRLRQKSPEAANVLIAVLAGQVRRLSQQLGEALYVAADRRVLRRLVDMAKVYDDGEAEDGPDLDPADPGALRRPGRDLAHHRQPHAARRAGEGHAGPGPRAHDRGGPGRDQVAGLRPSADQLRGGVVTAGGGASANGRWVGVARWGAPRTVRRTRPVRPAVVAATGHRHEQPAAPLGAA